MVRGPINTFKINVFLLIWVLFLSVCLGQNYELDLQWRELCPRMYLRVFTGFAPKGNESAGRYIKKDDIHSIENCITSCCSEDMCNVIFMYNKTCYQVCKHETLLHLCCKSIYFDINVHIFHNPQIVCTSNEMCAPLFRPEPQFGRHVSMVLVQPVSPEETWETVLAASWEDDYRMYVNLY